VTEIGRIKILVVDDEDNIRHLLRLAFEGDFEVVEASDGQDALEKALSETPDIIVSDIMMPRLDGYGLYRKLKSRIETSEIPFIFLSAKKDIDDRVTGLEMGADDYITKPFSIKELKAKVKSISRKLRDLKNRGSLEGLLNEVDLVDVIQLIEMSRKTGTLVLESRKTSGEIFFNDGQAVFARTDRWDGIEAFYTMLAWRDGSFKLDHSPVGSDPNINIQGGMELLMEGVRCMDEMRDAASRLPDTDTRLFPVKGGSNPEVPPEILNAFSGGATVEEAQERTTMPPYQFIPFVTVAWDEDLLSNKPDNSSRINVVLKCVNYLENL